MYVALSARLYGCAYQFLFSPFLSNSVRSPSVLLCFYLIVPYFILFLLFLTCWILLSPLFSCIISILSSKYSTFILMITLPACLFLIVLLFYPIPSYPIQPYPILSNSILSYPTISNLILSYLILFYPILPFILM